MRLLHTADLHLGRSFNGISLEDDHQEVLDQIVAALKSTEADVLIIAGDIFDRTSPPASAVRQFNQFISRVKQDTDAAIALIAGNHDSGDRIEAMAMMNDPSRHLVRGVPVTDDRPLILEDSHGPVAISGLPFAYEYAARASFGDESLASPEDVLKAQLAAARGHVPASARWVIIAHGFVAGGEDSEAERSLTKIGGEEKVHHQIFAGAEYVALGHLHRPQRVARDSEAAPLIHYSGAPLAFGFDEDRDEKSMTLVELGPRGDRRTQLIPFEPLRRVRKVQGLHADVCKLPASSDFIFVSLLDPYRLIDPMRQLRAVFPNACGLDYANLQTAASTAKQTPQVQDLATPEDVVDAFATFVRDQALSEVERDIVSAQLNHLQDEEARS